jgi:hypothetical protein
MVLRIATKEYFESLNKFLAHLPPTLDSELMVLKGHLLIERLLERYLRQNLAHPAELDEARFSFSQKLCVVAALHRGIESEWLWKAIRLLNVLRNELAHRLENVRRDALLEDFLRTVERSPELPEHEPPKEITERLHRAIFSVHEAMSFRVNL